MVAMPEAHRGDGRLEGDRLALPGDGALVGLVGSGEHLDECGLPGAVLAEEAVDLTGGDLQVHPVEGADAREGLGDAGHGEQGWFWCHGGSPRRMTAGERAGRTARRRRGGAVRGRCGAAAGTGADGAGGAERVRGRAAADAASYGRARARRSRAGARSGRGWCGSVVRWCGGAWVRTARGAARSRRGSAGAGGAPCGGAALRVVRVVPVVRPSGGAGRGGARRACQAGENRWSLMSRAPPMTPAAGPNSPKDDGQVAGRERQRLAVDLGADGGEQGVAEAGHPAADHHEPGVEEGDEAGDDLAGVAAAAPDQFEGGGVPAGGGGGHVGGAEPAAGLQPGGQFRGAALARHLFGVAGQGGAAEVGLQAPLVAAGAGQSVRLDLDVADVAGAAGGAAVDGGADHDAAADAGADLDAEEVTGGAGDPGVLFAHRHEVHVVVDHDGAAQFLAERLADREAVPAGHDRRGDGDALGEADRAGHADAGTVEPLGEAGRLELLGHVEDLLEDGDRPFADIHRLGDVAQHLQLGVGDGHIDRGGADVDAEEAQVGREADVVRTASAARGGEAVGDDEAGLQQPVHLDGEFGAGEVDLLAELGAGVGTAVAEQPQQARLVCVGGSCGHASHAPLPPPGLTVRGNLCERRCHGPPLPGPAGLAARAFEGNVAVPAGCGKKLSGNYPRLFPFTGQSREGGSPVAPSPAPPAPGPSAQVAAEVRGSGRPGPRRRGCRRSRRGGRGRRC